MRHPELCALRTGLFFTWDVTDVTPQAFSHHWDVLLLSSLCQTEYDLHEVPVHQSTVRTFCYFQSLTKSGENNKEDEQTNRIERSKVKSQLCLSTFVTYT